MPREESEYLLDMVLDDLPDLIALVEPLIPPEAG